jgi:hypothetical protein
MSTGYKIDGTDFEDIYEITSTLRKGSISLSSVINSLYKNPGSPSYTQLSQFAKKLDFQDSQVTDYNYLNSDAFSDIALKNWRPTWGSDLFITSSNKVYLNDAWDTSSFNGELLRITTPFEWWVTSSDLPDPDIKAVYYIMWGGGGGGGAGGTFQGSGGGGGGIAFGAISIPFWLHVGSGGAGAEANGWADGKAGGAGDFTGIALEQPSEALPGRGESGQNYSVAVTGGMGGGKSYFGGTADPGGTGGTLFTLSSNFVPEFHYAHINGQTGTTGGIDSPLVFSNTTTPNDYCLEKTLSSTPDSGIKSFDIYTAEPSSTAYEKGQGGYSLGFGGFSGPFSSRDGIMGGGGGGGFSAVFNRRDGTKGGDGGIILFY